MGGLFKRHLTTLARKKNLPWSAVLAEAESNWNSTYVSKLGMGVPNDWNQTNFDQLIARLYEKEPVRMHALYTVGSGFSEDELGEIFRFKPGNSVRVSMRTLNKRMQGPVSKPTMLIFSVYDSLFLLFFSLASITAS